MTMLVIKLVIRDGLRKAEHVDVPLFLSHPQANMVTEFSYIKCAPNEIPLRLRNIS